jgi:hypothetical protein
MTDLLLKRTGPIADQYRVAEIDKSDRITCARWVNLAPRFLAEAERAPPRPA